MRINKAEHLKLPWRVHRLLPDFKIEDTWLLPIKLNKSQNIGEVQAIFTQSLAETANTGVAGLLFKFRLFLGRIFGWEDEVNLFPPYQREVSGRDMPIRNLWSLKIFWPKALVILCRFMI